MLLRQIEYFQAVVERGSFTAAAEQCNISQSAISQQIQALEAELGVKLLERVKRRFTLTPAGELFYKRSVLITADLEQLRRDTLRVGRAGARELNVGVLLSYSGEEFNHAIAAFTELHPEIDLHVTAGNHEDLFDGLRLNKLDLVLNDQRRAFSDEYVNLILSESKCYVEIAAHNPLSRLDGIDIADLKNIPCILIASPAQRENEQSYYRDIVGFRGEFLFAETAQEAHVLVVSNKGVLPVELCGSEQQFGSAMKRVPLLRDGGQIIRNLCAFRKRENHGQAVVEFERLLVQEFLNQ